MSNPPSGFARHLLWEGGFQFIVQKFFNNHSQALGILLTGIALLPATSKGRLYDLAIASFFLLPVNGFTYLLKRITYLCPDQSIILLCAPLTLAPALL
jgi:hypothetical protein